MGYRIIGEAAMAAHFGFLCFVVLGGFLAWRWPRTVFAHAPVALYGLGIALIGWDCPLTYVENWARRNAGQGELEPTGFIDHYLTGVVYPENYYVPLQFAAGVVVVFSYAGAVWWRRRHARATHAEFAANRRNVNL
ncbi:DUF2784 domain-containing protein [Spiractinospora alimapuensis]|uniref:DUF2784 domain-containing protein n=1 Tax=Spiractinospora alimapuensis TaxID=2820884 RepID=UPI001F2D3961|nr:DUF2784 domain-containing protein [Spiractinospora alimapuensis]QVQ53082.1 DUF2784 domain-containing protein [Spiractinospora alimapuensis]